jgi:hypothetical protein
MGEGTGKEIRYSDEGGGNAHTLVSTILSENGLRTSAGWIYPKGEERTYGADIMIFSLTFGYECVLSRLTALCSRPWGKKTPVIR